MRSALLAALGLLMLAFSSLSRAAGDMPLYVEIVVNGETTDQIVPLRRSGPSLLVAGSDLRAAGVKIEESGEVDLSRVPGVSAVYDAAGQRLVLTVSSSLLPVTRLAADPRARMKPIASFGALLNYDLYAQRTGARSTLSAWTEQRVFGTFGIVSNAGTVRIANGARDAPTGYLRYDTRFRYIDEDATFALTVGDLITRSLPWSSSVRLGGIQIGRDFRVRPDLVTMPLPSFAGEAAVPSAVDLFIDGYRQQAAKVSPGRFVLDQIPVINGRGDATIVTTDAVGREVRTTIPFYVASDLLKPGLTDYSAELGVIRQGYGKSSFSYGAPAASGLYRLGLNSHVTIEAHGELSHGVQLAGGGVIWSPGILGVFNVAVAGSETAGGAGGQVLASYSFTGRRLGFQVQHTERTADFRDLGTFDLANYQGARSSTRATATMSVNKAGSLAAAYIDQRSFDSQRVRILSLSYGVSIHDTWTVTFAADHDLTRGRTSAQLRLMLPFGRNGVSAGVSRDPDRGMVYEGSYARAVPSAGGIGFNGTAATSDSGKAYGQAEAIWRGQVAQVQLGASAADGQSTQWIGLTGSIASLDRDVFLANQVSDAFAVVSTGDIPNIPIYFENQLLGRTGRDGRLFVPQVTAYQPSLFAIDPLALAIGETVNQVQTRVSIRAGAGALVQIPVVRARGITVPLVGEDGAALSAGGRAIRSDRMETAAVGWDGIVYLDDVGPALSLAVTRHDGRRCRADIVVPAEAHAMARLAPVVCR